MRAQTTGCFAVYSRSSGKELTPRGRKACALLAYLISDSTKKTAKDRIIGLLWGDRGDAQARSSLRQAIRELRLALNGSGQLIFTDREHIWLSGHRVIENSCVPDAWRKDAFEDLDNITPEYDEWLVVERSRRSRARIDLLHGEAIKLLADGRTAESLIAIDQINTLDPCNEDALRLGMEADFRRADPGRIAERFRAAAGQLQKDLGVKPSMASRLLRDRLIIQLTTREPTSPRETDHGYFVRRAAEERGAATRARSQKARQVHQKIAGRYEEMSRAVKFT